MPRLRRFDRFACRASVAVFAFLLACAAGSGVPAGEADPARADPTVALHVEAETMQMDGFRVHWNPEAGYSGHGGMALSYEKMPHEATRRPERLALTRRFRRPLPPGGYRVLVRYYDAVPKFRLSLGDATVEAELPKGGRYTVIPIATKAPADSLRLRIVECGFRVIVDYFFVTNDPRYETEKGTRGVRLVLPPRVSEAHERPAGNWIANASFEAGHPAGLAVPYQHNLALYASMADAAHAVHGTRSLKVPVVDLPWRDHFFSGSEIVFGPVHLEKDRRYRAAVQVRGDAHVTAKIRLRGKTYAALAAAERTLGEAWQRVGIATDPVESAGRYSLHVHLEAGRPATAWLDNLYFGEVRGGKAGEGESDGAEAFALRSPVEAGPIFAGPGYILAADPKADASPAVAIWCEPGDKTGGVRFEYRAWDWYDRPVAEGTIDLADAPAGRSTRPLPLPAAATGLYRLHYRTVRGETAGPWRQVSYAVLPEPREGQTGPIGVYGSLAPQALAIYRRAGFGSICTLSPAGHVATWNRVEPVYGKGYIFRDADVDRACEAAIHILCNINTQRHTKFPEGLPLGEGDAGPDEIGHKQGAFPVAAWKRFVAALAGHYKGCIRDWLIIDEPVYQYPAEEYFKLLKASSEAIRAADPGARVFFHGHTVVRPQYLEMLDRLGVHTICDGVYDYVRTRERGEALRAWSRKRDRLLWTVEYGGFATFYVRPPTGSMEAPVSLRARDNVAGALESAIRSLGWARAGRYYRYDARFTGHDNHMTLFEADGTLKPAGVALAVLNHELAGLEPEGEVSAPEGAQAFLFASADGCLLAFRHADRGAVVLRAGLDADRVTLSDCVGRALALTSDGGHVRLVVDRQFRYLAFAAADRQRVLAALESAQAAPAMDVSAECLRPDGGALTVRLHLANRSPEPFDGFVCPARKSLFHLAGYMPVKSEAQALRSRLRRPVHLAPGASATVTYALQYPADWTFEEDFPGARLDVNVESPSLSQVATVRLDGLPTVEE